MVFQKSGESPNQAIVEQVMRSDWDKAATDFNPKSELTVNSVRFGAAYVATLKEVQIDGIPESAMVTRAVIDFTVRTYYNSETRADRRVREALVYQDKMQDWAVKTGSVKGQDVSTVEPSQ